MQAYVNIKQILKFPKITNQSGDLNKLYYPKYNHNEINPYKKKSKSVISLDIDKPTSNVSQIIQDETIRAKNINQQIIERLQKNVLYEAPKNRSSTSMENKKIQQSFKSAMILQKHKLETAEQKIKNIIYEIFPLSSQVQLNHFIERFQNMKRVLKRSKQQQKRMDKVLKSKKHTSQEKLHILERKTEQLENQLHQQYEKIFQKHFKNQINQQQSFKKKFKKQIYNLTKTLNLTQ